MSIGNRTPGAWASGSTSVAPALPASPAVGDMMLLFVGCKPYTATINQPTGWTRSGTQQTSGSTASGTDTGSVTWSVFYRQYQSGDSAPTVSITNGNVALGVIHGFSKTTSNWITPVAYFGSDTSSGTGYSATASGSSGNLTAGDALLHATVIAGNDATFGTPTITATSATIGTVTESPSTEGSTTTGNDLEASSATAAVTAGTSSADAVCGWTLSVAQTGGSVLVRLREDVTQFVTVANVSQANGVTAVAVGQTQQVSVAGVTQANNVSSAGVLQTQLVSPTSVSQANAVSQASVEVVVLPTLVEAANVTQANTVFPAQVHVPANRDLRVDPNPLEDGYLIVGDEGAHLITVASVAQANLVSAVAIAQDTTAYITVADVVQVNTVSPASLANEQRVQVANVVQANTASSVTVQQTQLITVADVTQTNTVSGVSAGHIVLGGGHVWRIDTSPFYTDTLLIGDPGFGVLCSEIAAGGDDGDSYLYNDFTLPADADKEISGEIVTWPLHGEVFAEEDGSFIYTPNVDYVGPDSFEYQLRIDGETVGSPTLVSLFVGGDHQYVSAADVSQVNSVSGVLVTQNQFVVIANVTQVNSAAAAQISQLQLVSPANLTQVNVVSPVAVSVGDIAPQLVTCADVVQINEVSGCYVFPPGGGATTTLQIDVITGQVFLFL